MLLLFIVTTNLTKCRLRNFRWLCAYVLWLFSHLNEKKKRPYSIYQNSKIIPGLKFLLFPLLSYDTCKRSQQLPTLLGQLNVGRCCVRVGDGVQTDATPNNVGTCSASWEGYNPLEFDLGKCVAPTMLRQLCKRIQHCCATPRRSRNKKCRELFAQKFDRFKLRATACKSLCKRTQHVTPNNVAPVCTGLYGTCFLLL